MHVLSSSGSTTNAHSETGQMSIFCKNLPLVALSSRSAPSMLVGALFKKFGLFLNTGVYRLYRVHMPKLKPVTVGEIIITKFRNLCYDLQFISVVFRKCTRMGSLKYCNESTAKNVNYGTCDLYRINKWGSINPGGK